MIGTDERPPSRVGGLLLFVALAVIHTWPLATAPGVLTRHDNADTFLNQWTLAWVAHILPRDPLALFEANIFHPEPHTLAFSEHLFVQGVMGAPLAWMGASPVLVYNVVLLAGLVLSGWMTARVVSRWTGDGLAGAVAGSVVAFNAHTMSRLAHVQAMHVEFLPLALLAFDRVLVAPRVRHAVALAWWSLLQMLCSGYLLVLTVTTLVSSALARAGEWATPRRARQVVPLLVGAGAAAAAACLPFLVPYARVRADQGLMRTLDEVRAYSASGLSYLSTVGTLHHAWWSHRFFRHTDALFPGVVALLLAGVAVASGLAWRDRRARMVAAAGGVCLALSFGPAFLPYVWLYRTVPLVEGIRGAARFGYVAIFAVGVLAGFGLAHLRARRGSSPARRRAMLTVGVAALILVNLEALAAPHEFTRFTGIPEAYDALAREPHAVVVEVPVWLPEEARRNAPAEFHSTRYWHPLVNGYSGFTPPSYARHAVILQGFPDEPSIALLRTLGVTHVVVHTDDAPEAGDRLDRSSLFERVAEGPDLRVFRLLP